MIYQKPHLLYALFAIAIPIIIHLFNLSKSKKIYFSSIRFLKEIKEDNSKKSKLKNILILLSRILAITFLVLAFAKPYIPIDNYKVSNNIFLYIDNSKSMDIDFGDGNLLNKAKNKALEIAEAYPSDKNFFLITNDFESKYTSSYNSDDIKLQIEKIQASTKQRSISNIISRTNSIKTHNSHLYFISDFQKSTIQISSLKKQETNNKVSLIPIENNNTSNISIDSVFVGSPILKSDKKIKLHVIISNTGDKNIEEILFLYVDRKQKSQQYINLLAQETKEITIEFVTNSNLSHTGEIRTNDSPVTFDNKLFFTLKKAEKINVIAINNKNENTAFLSLFGKDTALFNFNLLEIESINHNTLSKQDFIILDGVEKISSGLLTTLLNFTNNGGVLLVVPPVVLTSLKSYNKLLESLGINSIASKNKNTLKINQFSTKNPLYKDVFTEELIKINYPVSNQSYTLNKQKISTKIIGFSNGEDFLSAYNSKKGMKYHFSSPLDKIYNNFTKHALFVPTLINIAASSILTNTPYYIIGSDQKVILRKVNPSTNIIRIKSNEIDIIPTITNKNGKKSLNLHNQIKSHGIYSILNNNEIIDEVAFNYNTSESIIESLKPNEINHFIYTNKIQNTNVIPLKKISKNTIIKEQEMGKEYWKLALLFSLIFFALEILLIKLITI